ncbi:MAG: hypothetical protein HUJ29_04415 [Gammaproteobacteria bacterium]|nr:hypothetical protein [Gammaproteobacteria bacterium]
MDSEFQLKKVSFWLQQAKDLMLAADQCWHSRTEVLKRIEEGIQPGFNNELLEMELNEEADLNWLYNILTGLAVYYLAVALLLSRDPERIFDAHSERYIVDLVEAGGINLLPIQRTFLIRVSDAMGLVKKHGAWKLSLSTKELAQIKQDIAQDYVVSTNEKLAMDGLLGNLINTTLSALTEDKDATTQTNNE